MQVRVTEMLDIALVDGLLEMVVKVDVSVDGEDLHATSCLPDFYSSDLFSFLCFC